MGEFHPHGHTATTKVLIDGHPLAIALDSVLEEIVVDQDVHVPDMATLRFRDHYRDLANGSLAIGDRLEVRAGERGGSPRVLIFAGEITAIEGHYDTTGSFVVVRGYDLEHRLHRGRRTTTYHNVKDSDLVRTIAKEAGLKLGKVADSKLVHDHVSRANQSGFDFLRARAGEIGFEMDVNDGRINFRPARAQRASVATLDLGTNLEAFYPRLSAAEQVAEVEVRSWDPGIKDAVVERTKATTDATEVSDSGADIAAHFPAERLVEVGRPLASKAEVDAVAKAVADQIAGAYAQADGVAIGDPALRAGDMITIENVGRQFNGTYTLTSCQHRFVGGLYRTGFVVSGRQHRSLLGLVSLGETNRLYDRPRVNGVVIGQVTDVADPDKLGRVKVKLPWLSNDYESTWARLASLGAGYERGMLFVPEVGDEVLIAFEHGDIRSPYVLGGLYNGVDGPADRDAVNANGSINHRSITSRVGHQLLLNDEGGNESIVVSTGDDSVTVKLSQADTTITISSQGDVVIKGSKKVSVEAGSDLSLKARKNIDIEAGGTLNLDAKVSATMSSKGPTTVKGTTVQLNP